MKRPWVYGLIAAAAATVVVLLLIWRFPDAVTGRDGQIDLVQSLLILLLVGSSAVLYRGMSWGRAARMAAIWVVAFAVLITGYAFRHDMRSVWDRVAGAVVPHAPVAGIDGGVVIHAGNHGHFVVEAAVRGDGGTDARIRFLVDTGASDVVLSPADARRIGLDPATLAFTRTYRTANGNVAGAPIRLNRLAIGSIVLDDVRASVNSADMNRSLLGMSFLNRLSGYSVDGDRLIMRP